MKPVLFVPVLISVSGAPTQKKPTPVVELIRDNRGILRAVPCARFDLADPKSFISDDTVRAKRCVVKTTKK
jgi:hypothetical protein